MPSDENYTAFRWVFLLIILALGFSLPWFRVIVADQVPLTTLSASQFALLACESAFSALFGGLALSVILWPVSLMNWRFPVIVLGMVSGFAGMAFTSRALGATSAADSISLATTGLLGVLLLVASQVFIRGQSQESGEGAGSTRPHS